SPEERNALVGKFAEAVSKKEERAFARAKNLTIFPLKATSATPAYVLINPAQGAVLSDDSSLQPLLRIVELGMDVVALRNKEKSLPAELEVNAYVSSNLLPGFIHSSPAMASLIEEIYKIRSSDVTVLVTGESGTGKELVSRA